MAGTTTPPRYSQVLVYGPFHRKTKSGQDPRRLLAEVLQRGELWGRGQSTSHLLAAMAFFGPLPSGASGFEFYAFLEPHSPWGGQVYWHVPPHGPAREDKGWAKIEIMVIRASSDSL